MDDSSDILSSGGLSTHTQSSRGLSTHTQSSRGLSTHTQSSRSERQASVKSNYILGKRKRPILKYTAMTNAVEEQAPDPDGPSCNFCHVTLRNFGEVFKSFTHTGSALKKRKLHPPKTRRSVDSYRDMSSQNTWLLATIFDDKGNYNYCNRCVVHYLGVGKQRLASLRQTKIARAQCPFVMMTKKEVTEKSLLSHVAMPSDVLLSFTKWWASIGDEVMVKVHNPVGRHGLSGKPSNNAKEKVRQDFLKFVDLHSQPNGRQGASFGAHFYFDSVFTRFAVPKKSVKNYSAMCQRSVVATFNSVQTQLGKGTCSSSSASTWLSSDRPKHAIAPQKLDYCDTCVEYKEQAKRFRQIGNRLLESGSATEDAVESNYILARSYDQLLKEHKEVAKKSLDFYRSSIKECSDSWETITGLSRQDAATLTEGEVERLSNLKRNFSVVLSFDYQQNKNLPHWGYSEQPGETYYKMKCTCNVFGIIDHRNNTRDFKCVYICDERAAGSKSADMTISFLDRYIQRLPDWVKGLTLFADNAGTNKNYYILAWAMELVRQGRYLQVLIVFLVPGHSKFAPDILFAQIGSTYSSHDVFTIQELGGIIERYALCTVFDHRSIYLWRDHLSSKYRPFQGIKSYKDFRIKLALNRKPKLMYRQHPFEGSYITGGSKLPEDESIELLSIPSECYQIQEISNEKKTHLIEMYNRYIPIERRLPWLPPLQLVQNLEPLVSKSSSDHITSEPARAHQRIVRKRK